MSYINEIEFDFEIGDRYELSPIEMTYLVGKIMALGGGCYIDGNVVVVTSMPGKTYKPTPQPEPKVKWFAPEETAPVENTPEVTPEPVAEEAPKEEVKEATAEVKQPPSKRAPKTEKPEETKENSKPEEAKKEDSKPEEAKKSDPIPAPVEE